MKKPKKKASGGNWMDTYGDMVTLLLCFFVLLYSISTIDQTKWQNFVKSMNPELMEEVDESTPAQSEQTGEAVVEQTTVEKEFQTMYEELVREFESMGLDAEVSVIKGDGYNFISFRDEVFFDGDSYTLREEGRQALDGFCRAITPAAQDIKEIEVLGHTTQALPNVQNNPVSDRMLSTERAAQVTAYIQQKNMLDPARLVSLGFGQFRPIASFDTEENRKKNRRVEILITNDEAVQRSLTEYYAQIYGEEVAAMQADGQKYQE